MVWRAGRGTPSLGVDSSTLLGLLTRKMLNQNLYLTTPSPDRWKHPWTTVRDDLGTSSFTWGRKVHGHVPTFGLFLYWNTGVPSQVGQLISHYNSVLLNQINKSLCNSMLYYSNGQKFWRSNEWANSNRAFTQLHSTYTGSCIPLG